MIAKMPNIFTTMLQDMAQQDLLVIETESTENSNNSSIYDDLFTTKWDEYDDDDDTLPQMFLTEPYIDHPNEEPEMIDPEPEPIHVDPAPQQRQTHFILRSSRFFTVEDVLQQKWNLRFQEFLA